MTTTSSTTSTGWERRPILGWTVRVLAVAGPLLGSLAAAWTLTSVTPSSDVLGVAVARWLLIAAASSLVLVGLDRLSRRMLPIAWLLDLALAFPDQAPSRFRLALRTGTTAQLQRRIDEAQRYGEQDTPAAAATRVIELVAALRVHDPLTRGHSERVRAYTQMIAEEMGLSDEERDRLRWAGLLHDVGKLLVPTSILGKSGTLTDAEYDIVKTHPENGRRIIAPLVPWLGDSARAVWEHHEKWDGSGYPSGLAGTDISLAARIVAVADVYDVLTSARSYKEPISPREARRELARCAGSHFDPAVVRAFLNLSVGRVRRATGPASWVAQLALFPTAALSSTQAAGSAVVITGALGASSAGVGTELVADTMSVLDPRPIVAWVDGVGEPDVGDVAMSAPVTPASGSVPERTTAFGPVVTVAGTTLGSGTSSTPTAPVTTVTAATPAPPPTPPTPPDNGPSARPTDPSSGPPATLPATANGDPSSGPPATTATVPATTLPATTVPATLPATTIPATTIPATTIPATTAPATTAPAATVPAMTLPATTVPAKPGGGPAGGGGASPGGGPPAATGGPSGDGPPAVGRSMAVVPGSGG